MPGDRYGRAPRRRSLWTKEHLMRRAVAGLSLIAVASISSFVAVAGPAAAAAARPEVASVSPSTVSTVGSDHVTIRGAGFTAVSSVVFGRTRALAFRALSSSVIVAYAPGQSHRTVHVI